MRYEPFKRAFDVILSSAGLVLSFPLWVIISFLIFCEDRGPIFFLQDRVGRFGIRLKTIKFRTMKQGGVLHLDIDFLEDDPRVTHVGRALRATAMDELPQLINILRGEMSFVGPKPLPFVIDDEDKIRYKYLDQVPGYETRIKVRPGLTGLAQVYAPKTASREDKFKLDNSYIERQSLFLDLKLIFISFLVTFRGRWESSGRKI